MTLQIQQPGNRILTIPGMGLEVLGPRGVAVFSPSDIAGLQLWLDAGVGLWQDSVGGTPAVADSDVVGAWADQSGNSRHVTQATTSKKPLLKLNIMNGKPVVRFDGLDDILSLAAEQSYAYAAIFFVVSSTKTGSNAVLGGTYIRQLTFNYTSGRFLSYQHYNTYIYWNDNPAQDDGNPHVHTVYSPGPEIGDSKWYVDGAVQTKYSRLGTTKTIYLLDIGGASGPSKVFSGDMAEVVVYNSDSAVISDADRQRVERYLAAKYGIP